LNLEPITLEGWPFRLQGIAYGQGTRLQLEVIYSEYDRLPSPTQLRSAWKTRQNRRGVPLLVVVIHNDKAHVCGPSGEDPTVYPNLNAGQVERICQEALEQPSRQAALRALRDSLGSLEEEGLPGLRNEGFLATHELTSGVPNRSDWMQSKDKARRILGHKGNDLLASLGFTVEPLDNVTNILKVGDLKNAVAVLLTDTETPESGSERIPGNISPVSYALARADEENLDWVMLLHGRKIRLYPVKMDVGVGRKGRTETYLECHTGLIPDDQAAYLWLLFSAEALAKDGSLDSILTDSKDFAGDLANRLRERIYDEVIPRIAEGLAKTRSRQKPTAQQLAETYEMAMMVLFRLLFVAYGEDKDLLPCRSNGLYQKRSLKAKAKELLELWNSEEEFGPDDTWWREVQAIFSAVDKGNSSWGVPAYNGGLFSSDTEESKVGAALKKVSLPDKVFGPVLQHLLLVPTPEGVMGPVDFRSLGVREFGTVYEGLLESELSIAETDLTLETKGKTAGTYRPSKKGEEVTVTEEKIYLHNSSGARKSSGSYYTKQFAVEHLLEESLEPSLDEHFARLDTLDELEAGESFFDFKVSDISMGSGHFLVAAVDRIEARFSGYLSKRNLPVVSGELERLRKSATEALGDAADSYPDFEDNALLRRLIARRCIYGVDINEVAVHLARLAIWIHTFIPGLPLSLLDRNLVQGNSLVGIGQLSEIEDKVNEDGETLFAVNAKDFVGDASEALARLGRLTEATHAEVKQARKAWTDAGEAIGPAKALCDILTAARIENERLPFDFTNWQEEKGTVVRSKAHQRALSVLEEMSPLHFPIAFPEVFLRKKAGFDVILGNPPWKAPVPHEDAFWARHFPGLRGLPASEGRLERIRLRKARPDLLATFKFEQRTSENMRRGLTNGPFPGIGTGDPDLYKAFCWRFWALSRQEGGRVGVVMPRIALSAKGSEQFRKELFQKAKRVSATILYNRGFWVFDMDNRKAIALLNWERGDVCSTEVCFNGPYENRAKYDSRLKEEMRSFKGDEVLSWTDSASLPLLPAPESVAVFSRLRESPRLDLNDGKTWRARAYGEAHAGNCREYLLPDGCEANNAWPVYKGESFDIDDCDTGKYYGFAEPTKMSEWLDAPRRKRLRGKAFSEFSVEWCKDPKARPWLHCRIAVRDVTNRTNQRTVVCAVVPPKVFLTDKAPYFLFPRGNARDQIFLYGVLRSLSLDWYARRYVETGLKLYLIKTLPVPRPEESDPLRLRVIELAGRLACTDERLADWATGIGVECGPLEEDERTDMIHELDAVVARLYGLTRNHLVHIFETFHKGWNYQSRLTATLEHYVNWGEEE
jgi:hypothetical protein